MADIQDIDMAFQRLTRDIVRRVDRPSPMALARRAAQRRRRQVSFSAAVAVVVVVLGGTALIRGLPATDDQVPSLTAASDPTTLPAERAADVMCERADGSNEMVAPGIRLAWSSSFSCGNARLEGTYELTVRVVNAAGNRGAFALDSVQMAQTTPRTREGAPHASGQATRLPLVVDQGHAGSLVISGTYELAATDEGKKANLHLRIVGRVVETGTPFSLAVVAHLRAPGAVEDGSGPTRSQAPGDRTEEPPDVHPEVDRTHQPPRSLDRYAEQMRRWARCVARQAPMIDLRGTSFDPLAECGRRPEPPS